MTCSKRGRRDHDPRLLDEVSRIYPVAEVVPDALLALGEAPRRPAAGAGGPGLQAALEPGIRVRRRPARALWRLAHAYAAEKFLVSARDTLSPAPCRVIPAPGSTCGPRCPAGRAGRRRLARPPLPRSRPTAHGRRSRSRWFGPGICRLPSTRTGQDPAAAGMPPGLETSRVFLVEGTKLGPLDPATGQRGGRPTSARPGRLGRLPRRQAAGRDPQRVVALDLRHGRRAVAIRPGGPRRAAAARPDPFARAEPASGEPGRGARPAPRVPDRRRPALLPPGRRGDRDRSGRRHRARSTGRSRRAAAPINPKLWIGPERIGAPGPQAGPDPRPRDRQRAGSSAGLPWPRAKALERRPDADRRGPRPRWSRIAGRSRSSTWTAASSPGTTARAARCR